MEKSPLKAIRAKCLDCCCGSAYEVKNCTIHVWLVRTSVSLCRKSESMKVLVALVRQTQQRGQIWLSTPIGRGNGFKIRKVWIRIPPELPLSPLEMIYSGWFIDYYYGDENLS